MSKVMKRVEYFYFRDYRRKHVSSKVGVVVCYLPIYGKETPPEPTGAVLGVSFCSPEDNFNKKIGRGQAFSNALANKKNLGLDGVGDIPCFKYPLMTREEASVIAGKIIVQRATELIEKKEDILRKEIKKVKSFFNEQIESMSFVFDNKANSKFNKQKKKGQKLLLKKIFSFN